MIFIMLCSLMFSGDIELPDRYYGADCQIYVPGNPTTWFKNVYDDPCTNVGRGSSLIEGSHVECDASVMDGESGAFGAVGALQGAMEKGGVGALELVDGYESKGGVCSSDTDL